LKTILILHKGGTGGIRGMEACMIQAVRAMHEAGFRIVVALNLPVADKELLPYSAAIINFSFPELNISRQTVSMPIIKYFRSLQTLRNIIRSYDVDVIYASGGLPCQLAVPAARLMGKKVLCHFHHPVGRWSYYLWLVKFADQCIFPSEFTRFDALSKSGKDGVVIYNGIDIDRFHPTDTRDLSFRREFGIAEDAIVLGQIGQLTEHKRPGFLLDVFSRLADKLPFLHLCIIGGGPMEGELKAEIARLGLQGRVTLPGRVDDLLPWYQHVIDINVMVSREEGLGLTVLEAESCGLPSIVTDCTGLRETIVDGQTGFNFDVNDQDELIRLIETLALDGNQRKKMGEAARGLVKSKFNLKQYRRNIVNEISGLLH